MGGVPARGAGPESPGPPPRPHVCSSRQLHPPLCFSLAKKLTFNQARKSLGLHHCRQFFNLGLGLPRATMDYFLSLNMPIFELYGLSESTGIHTLSRQQDFRLMRWVLVEGWADGGQGCRTGGMARADLEPLLLGRVHVVTLLRSSPTTEGISQGVKASEPTWGGGDQRPFRFIF